MSVHGGDEVGIPLEAQASWRSLICLICANGGKHCGGASEHRAAQQVDAVRVEKQLDQGRHALGQQRAVDIRAVLEQHVRARFSARWASRKTWEIDMRFDRSAPIGPLHPVALLGHASTAAIWLKVNGVTQQSAKLSQTIWNVAEQISRLSAAFELKAGDIIYSGTPENVGPVVRGDVIDCHIDGLPNLGLRIV